MNFTLAMQLREAGYPQMVKLSSKTNDRPWLMEDPERFYTGGTEPHAYNPTLGELVEACGDEGVFTMDWRKGRNTWEVSLHRNGMDILVSGATPEEAVSKLWLALNKKPSRCLCGQVSCPICKGEDIQAVLDKK